MSSTQTQSRPADWDSFSSGESNVHLDEEGDVQDFRFSGFEYSGIGRFVAKRFLDNRDVKMLITASGGQTGTGKTQLAIQCSYGFNYIANCIFDRTAQWSAEDHSFVDGQDYLEAYESAQKGDVLLTDELEYYADRRRSMSNQNLWLSQAWQILRYKNVVTIGTCPYREPLDHRIVENADLWINVVKPGLAYPYYLRMDDQTGKIHNIRFKYNGYKERIKWDPIDDNDDYQWLSKQKRELGVPGMNEGQNLTKSDVKDAKKETKVDIIASLLEDTDMPQTEIADVVDMSQGFVSKVKRKHV